MNSSIAIRFLLKSVTALCIIASSAWLLWLAANTI